MFVISSRRVDNSSRRPRPLVIGLLGGVGSGKTHVAALFERIGALRIDADALAHEILTRPAVRGAIRRRFGDAVFHPDGSVSRVALGAVTFRRPTALRALERMIHPRVGRLIRASLARARRGGRFRLVLLDVPLLAESGWHRACDRLVYVHAPAALRESRVRASRGWPAGERRRRERLQMPLKRKQQMADFTIVNGADSRAVPRQVRRLVRTLPSPVHPFPQEAVPHAEPTPRQE